MSRHTFTVKGDTTYLDGKKFLALGLRCSNALFSDASTAELIDNLDLYASCGVNTVSVFFMGNRFSDFAGYNEDAGLNPTFTGRMARIIEAADARGIVVIVGCLYWGETKGKWESWTQKEANAAVKNTVAWLRERGYRNVLVDVDNEGMARAQAGFDNRELVLAARSADPATVVATNYYGMPPAEADLGIHHSDVPPGKPYIESEGTPENAPGAYWGKWSRKFDPINKYRRDPSYWNYINVGVYTDEMKKEMMRTTKEHLDRGMGFLMASTWMQAPPPLGPHHAPGGDGSKENPGIRWWLDFIKTTYGPYRPA